MQSNKILTTIALALTVFLSGCGLMNPVGPLSLNQLTDNSINLASSTISGGVIHLVTQASAANPVGSFVGGGNGNKAMAGIDDFDRTSLAAFQGISYETKANVGAVGLYVNLLVDLDCTLSENPGVDTIATYRSNRKVITLNVPTSSVLLDGYTRFSANATDAAWAVVAGPLGGLPDNGGGTGASLAPFVAAFPSACIINGITTDGGLGRNTSYADCNTGAGLATTALGHCGKSQSGILFVVGGSNTLTANDYSLRNIQVNSTTYR